jgi:hypothetical protein
MVVVLRVFSHNRSSVTGAYSSWCITRCATSKNVCFCHWMGGYKLKLISCSSTPFLSPNTDSRDIYNAQQFTRISRQQRRWIHIGRRGERGGGAKKRRPTVQYVQFLSRCFCYVYGTVNISSCRMCGYDLWPWRWSRRIQMPAAFLNCRLPTRRVYVIHNTCINWIAVTAKCRSFWCHVGKDSKLICDTFMVTVFWYWCQFVTLLWSLCSDTDVSL